MEENVCNNSGDRRDTVVKKKPTQKTNISQFKQNPENTQKTRFMSLSFDKGNFLVLFFLAIMKTHSWYFPPRL